MRGGYKASEFGDIPESWEVVKLGSVGNIISGGTPDTNNTLYWNGEIPWCTPTDITSLKGAKYILTTKRNISHLGLKSSSATQLPSNSLIICTRATIGDCAINRFPLTTNQGFKSIVPSLDWSIEFLYYLIISNKEKIIKLSSGSTFLEISKKAFENIHIQFPPLPEQQKIASILSTVDEKIENIDAQISQTRELKKSLMQQLLTKGIGHTQFKKSELGEIPKSWEVVRFGDVIKNYDNKRIPLKSEDRSNIQGIYPYYGAQGIIDYIDKYIFNGEYLLIAEDGENVKSRKNDIAFLVKGKFWVNNHAHIVLSNEKSDLLYLKYILNHISIIEFITGQAQPKLNKSALELIKIPLPSVLEQEKIGNILNTVDEKLESLLLRKKTYQQLKKGLMQQLLTGKIRVNVNEPALA